MVGSVLGAHPTVRTCRIIGPGEYEHHYKSEHGGRAAMPASEPLPDRAARLRQALREQGFRHRDAANGDGPLLERSLAATLSKR